MAEALKPDIYSLGVLLYTLMYMDVPYASELRNQRGPFSSKHYSNELV